MPGGPALCGADLEHAGSRLQVPLEEDAEPALGRAPGTIVPAELTVQVRQRRVDAVIRLVPALLAGEHRPRVQLAQLRLEARSGWVEQTRNAVLHGVRPRAAAAGRR